MPSTQRTTPGVSPCRALVAVSIWGCRSDMRHANATASAKFPCRGTPEPIILPALHLRFHPPGFIPVGRKRPIGGAFTLAAWRRQTFIFNGRFPAMLLWQ